MLRKALTLPLLFISASAFAWPSAEEAVKQFIDFELDGGRLSSDSYQEYEKSMLMFLILMKKAVGTALSW